GEETCREREPGLRQRLEARPRGGAGRLPRRGLRRRPPAPRRRGGLAASPRRRPGLPGAARRLARGGARGDGGRRLCGGAGRRTRLLGAAGGAAGRTVQAVGGDRGGGMGEVWMAQQTEPVKRLVALKVVKAGMDSRQVLARFEAERQALAL